MPFKTIVAPHVNVNDLEMIVTQWLVTPWQFIQEGDRVCEVETTKAVVTVEADAEGYIYPLVQEGQSAKVGEPLAHVFPNSDPQQLKALNDGKGRREGTIVTKKAQALMDEHGLTVTDFPQFSTISFETVVARIRELDPVPAKVDLERLEGIIDNIRITNESVVIYGELNQSLLAFDAFQSTKSLTPVAYINPSFKEEQFFGLPVLPGETMDQLKKRGLRHVYLCARDIRTKKEQIKECERLDFDIASAVHASAVIAPTAVVGRGVFIGALAAIGPDAAIGDFSQLLCSATIAHHSKIGRFVTICDGSHLASNVIVGDESFIGIGVSINRRIQIGGRVTIVSGVTVVDHVGDGRIVRSDLEELKSQLTEMK